MTSRGKPYDLQMKDFWSSSIKHRPQEIQDQLEVGLYSIKRYAFYLQKIVEIRRPALLELRKATDHEGKEKTARASKDAMSDHVQNYSITQTIQSTLFELETTFLNVIDRDVVQFILNWHKLAEKRLEGGIKKLTAITQKQKELLLKIAKSRRQCHDQWASLQSAFKESEKCDQQKLTKKNGAKEYENAYKKYTKQISTTYSLFNAFENEVRDANEQQRNYWEEELPLCIKDFEQLETDRLQTWGIATIAFRNAQSEYYTKSSESILALDETTLTLDGSHEIKQFTDHLTKVHGLPVPPDPIQEYLPCPYTKIQQGDDLQHLLGMDLSVALAQRSPQPTLPSSQNPLHSNRFISSLASAYTKPTHAHFLAKVLYDYNQQDADDLPLKEGDIIAILDYPSPRTEEPQWWIAAKFDGQTGRLLHRGIIPSNFVSVLD